MMLRRLLPVPGCTGGGDDGSFNFLFPPKVASRSRMVCVSGKGRKWADELHSSKRGRSIGKRRFREENKVRSKSIAVASEEQRKKRKLEKMRDEAAPLLEDDITLSEGKRIHNRVIRSGLQSDRFIGNLLIRMYRKCGLVEEARAVFDKIDERTVSSWNAMIGAYIRSGNYKEALRLFKEMKQQGVKPDRVTFTTVLGACAVPEALEEGKAIHISMLDSGLESNVTIDNAIVNMYAKCGALEIARSAFDDMAQRTVVSWNTLMDAYSKHGDGTEALQIFREMQQKGMQPDNITFVCLLSACSHAGLVDEGQAFFASMIQEHEIAPTLQHYSCMIDLLARAGQLKEAEDLIDIMPLEPDIQVWMSLLGASRTHGDVERAERAAKHLYDLDPQHASPYVLLSNTYATTGNWDGVQKVRRLMTENNIIKPAACSWIEIENKVHTFVAGDRSHPRTEAIYDELTRLRRRMREEGFVPDTKLALHNVEDNIKEDILCGHSERLAIALGLISTAFGTTLHVTKNLRVCPDCHSATKFISKISSRKIVVRDVNRFHHFRGGFCSCGDYW